jgi:hypothetical protein
MTARVYVHVGPHKTGTTFVQQVLNKNSADLAEQGVLFPGRRYSDQRDAVLELLRTSRRGDDADAATAWSRLAAEVTAWRGGTAIISVENLDAAGDKAMARIVESLAPAEVHVVYTARDLTQVLPAMWHTRMRNRETETWQSYITEVRDAPDTDKWPRQIRGQDPRLVLDRWEGHVPRDRIHLVTVPRPGTPLGLLWERFCSVVGLEAQQFSLDVPRVNKSLGTAETELLRRINERVADSISRPTYDRWVQVFIARRVLERREGQRKFGLPPEDHDWLRTYSDKIIAFLKDRGYDVTGDLNELVPEQAASTVAPDAADDAQVLDAAVDALAGVLLELNKKPRKKAGATAARARSAGAAMAHRLRRRAGSWLRRQ